MYLDDSSTKRRGRTAFDGADVSPESSRITSAHGVDIWSKFAGGVRNQSCISFHNSPLLLSQSLGWIDNRQKIIYSTLLGWRLCRWLVRVNRAWNSLCLLCKTGGLCHAECRPSLAIVHLAAQIVHTFVAARQLANRCKQSPIGQSVRVHISCLT